MQAEELRSLSKQCAELARTIPVDSAAFEQREVWWKAVRALRVGVLQMETIATGVLLEPRERSELRDALGHIDTGKNFKNTPPDSGSCVQGLQTVARVTAALADRMRMGKGWAEMSGDALREAGILVCVFGVLDGLVHEPRWKTPTLLVVLAVGAAMLILGVVVERKRR